MSALGHKQTFCDAAAMSAFPQKRTLIRPGALIGPPIGSESAGPRCSL